VKAQGRATQRFTLRWMELEEAARHLVTSTVLQVRLRGSTINLLDTPGQPRFFQKTTYRTWPAADNAVMLEDCRQRPGAQTRKLFEVLPDAGACRSSPFINKMDRPGR